MKRGGWGLRWWRGRGWGGSERSEWIACRAKHVGGVSLGGCCMLKDWCWGLVLLVSTRDRVFGKCSQSIDCSLDAGYGLMYRRCQYCCQSYTISSSLSSPSSPLVPCRVLFASALSSSWTSSRACSRNLKSS